MVKKVNIENLQTEFLKPAASWEVEDDLAALKAGVAALGVEGMADEVFENFKESECPGFKSFWGAVHS